MDKIEKLKKEEAQKLSILNRLRFWVATHLAERQMQQTIHDSNSAEVIMNLLEKVLRRVGVVIVGTAIFICLLVPAVVFLVARSLTDFDTASTYALYTFLALLAIAFITAFLPDEDPELIDVLVDLYRD